jgi:hypothetical protein
VLGEGLAKDKKDFAAEVSAAIAGQEKKDDKEKK